MSKKHKTIYVTKRQLDEIFGADSSYLDQASTGFREYGDNEITTGSKLSGRKDAKPVTTDKIASTMSKDSGVWYNPVRGAKTISPMITLCCSLDNGDDLELVLEDNSKLVDRTFTMDPTTLKKLKDSYSLSNNAEDAAGMETARNIMSNNGKVSYRELKRLKNRIDNGDKGSEVFKPVEGYVNRTLNSAANSVKATKAANASMGMQNTFLKAHSRNNGGTAHTAPNGMITY